MKYLIILTLVLLSQLTCKAQSYSPLMLTQKMFSHDSFPDIANYCTDEFRQPPYRLDLPTNVEATCTLLGQYDKTAVVNVTLTSSVGKAYDLYIHLRKDTVWKASAFRALSLTGMFEKMNKQLRSLTPQQVDSIINAPGKTSAPFKTKQEYQYLLGNTGLILASDAELMTYFVKNRAAFEKLKDDLIKNGILKTDLSVNRTKKLAPFVPRLKALWLDNAYRDRTGSPNNLNFIIGGITDNSVGYLYIKNPQNVPEMSTNEFIMVRKIADGWYLYKTTEIA